MFGGGCLPTCARGRTGLRHSTPKAGLFFLLCDASIVTIWRFVSNWPPKRLSHTFFISIYRLAEPLAPPAATAGIKRQAQAPQQQPGPTHKFDDLEKLVSEIKRLRCTKSPQCYSVSNSLTPARVMVKTNKVEVWLVITLLPLLDVGSD